MSVRWKIILAMVLLSFAVVVVMGFLSVGLADQILGNRAREFMSAIVDRSVFELNQQILSSENEVDSVYQDFTATYEPAREARDPGYTAAYLKKIAPSVELAGELNPSKGAYLILFDPTRPGVILGSVCYADQDRDGVVDRAEAGPVLDRLGGTVFLPPFGRDGGKIWIDRDSSRTIDCLTTVTQRGVRTALLGVPVDKELVISRIRRTTYLSSGFLFLTDQEGRVLYHPQVRDGTQLDISQESRELKFSNRTGLDGHPVLFGQLRLQNGWHLGLQVRTSDIRKGLDSMVEIILTIMALAMTGAAAAGFLSGHRIGRPYIYLSEEIGKIGSGNYDIELAADYLVRKDEAGTLTRAIDQMVRRQKASFGEIQNYSQNLERLIETRTAELVKTTKSLARSEKIASLTYLVGGIAHQMNTPMGNAMMAVSFLQDQIEKVRTRMDSGNLGRTELEESLTTADESCRLIQRSLEKSIQLIEQFKGLAPVKQDGSQVSHNLGQVVRFRASAVSQKFPGLSCRFTWEIPDDLEFYCNIDNLNSIFRELMENSFAHGFREHLDPEIRIRIEPLGEPVRGIRILYADNGRGITPDQVKELFTPFYTTWMGQEHSGLGLNMVYNLVLGVFNGDITVDDSVRPGLGYRISLFQETGL